MSARAPSKQELAPGRSVGVEHPESPGSPAERHLMPALLPALVSAVSGYVLLVAVGRQFEPDQFPVVAALVACAVILAVPGSVFQVARTPSAKRTVGRKNGMGRSTPLSRILGMLAGGSFLLLALTPTLDRFLHVQKGSTGLLAPCLFLSAISGLAIGALRRHIDVWRYAVIAATRLVVSVGFGLVFANRGMGPAGVLLALAAGEGAVLAVVGIWWLTRPIRSRSDRPARGFLPALAPRHAGMAAALIGGLWLVAHFDVVLARHYLPPQLASHYAAAWTVARVVLGPIVLVAVYSFRVSTRWTLAAADWLRRLLGITWGIALASIGILLAFRSQALSLVFGPRFEQSGRLVPTFALGMGLFAASAVLAQFHLFARSRAFLLVIVPAALQVVLAALFHSDDELLFVAAGSVALAAGALYHAAMAISRWPQPLGGLSPHEELIPAAGAKADRSPVELSLVLPCHNAGPQLREFLVSLQGHLDSRVSTEIIVVSDGSTDDTVRIAGDFASDAVRVFHYPERLGKGHALRVGLHQARGDYVAFIDSDGDVDPEAIVPFFSLMQLYQPDIVLGSKRHPLSQVDYPRLRRLLSWVYHVIGRILFRINVRDTQTGLKLIRRDVLAAVLPKMLEKRYAFDLELLVAARRLGYTRIFEAPVKIRYHFTSNVDPAAAFRILLDTSAIFYRRYVLNTYSPSAPLIGPAQENPAAAVDEDDEAQVAVEAPPGEPSDRPIWRHWAVRATRALARPEAVLVGMIAAYVVVFGRLTWLQQSNFGTFGFDQGIFDQEIWLASHFKSTFITVRGLDMWANHVNPNVYLLVPFYWLGAGPHFLSLLQTIGLALGAVPLWLLARDRLGESWLALGIPAAWLLYPSVQWMTWWHFHPESLAVTPLLFAWWLADRRRWGWYVLCLLLVLAAKEDTALAVLALGIVVAVRHHRVAGLLTTVAALGWLVTCFKVIIPATGVTAPFYADQYPTLGTSTNQIVYNAIRHPSRLFRLAFNHDRYDYYVKMLAPVAGLALLAPLVLFIALPTTLENVANNQGYPHNYMFQYQALVSAGIFLAVVEAIGRWKRPGFRRFLVGVLCASALVASVAWSPSPLNGKTYRSGIWATRSTAHTRAMDDAVHLIPADASVSTSYSAVPHLTHRTLVYEWPNPWIRANYGVEGTEMPDPGAVQYLLLDTGLNPENRPLFECLTGVSGPFRILFDRDGAVLAKRVVIGQSECPDLQPG